MIKDLDETIQHCLEVAEKQGKLAENNMNIQIEKYKVYDADEYIKCKECAEEHRQLAEWLVELKRARVLLKATHELLMKQNDNSYVLNLLSETIFYDDAECGGRCLMEDIECLLEDHI